MTQTTTIWRVSITFGLVELARCGGVVANFPVRTLSDGTPSARSRFVRRTDQKWPAGGGHTGASRSSLRHKQGAARRVKRADPHRADDTATGALDATAALCSQ